MPYRVSKDGQTFYDIDSDVDTSTGVDKSLQAAVQKGYKVYTDVSKDGGKTPFTIVSDIDPSTMVDKSLSAALHKGYRPVSVDQNIQDAHTHRDNIGIPEAAARGLANFGSFGTVDESAGAQNVLTAKGGDTADNYRFARDQYRMDDDDAWKQHPWAYGAGAAASLIPGLFAAGGKAAVTGGQALVRAGEAGAAEATTSSGARALGAAKTGALQGLVGGVGGGTDETGQADYTRGEWGKAAGQAGAGAAIGGALGAAGSKFADKLTGLAPAAEEAANQRAAKATGTMIKEQRLLEDKPGGVSQYGRDMLDLGIVSGGASLKDIAERSETARKSLGQKIGQFLGMLDKTTEETPNARIDADQVAKRIQNEVIDPLSENPFYDDIRKSVQGHVDAFTGKFQGQKMTFTQLNGIKSGLDDLIYRGQRQASPTVEELRKVRGIINDEINGRAEDVLSQVSPETLGKFQVLKRLYGSSATASDTAGDMLLRREANRTPSPSDYGAGFFGGLAGMMHSGNPVLAAGTAVASGLTNKVARERGNQLMAGGLDKISDLLEKNPTALGKFASVLQEAAARGGAALGAVHDLLYRNDPEYKKTVDSSE